MGGFITERDFDTAENEFPGIRSFYEHLAQKPRTFLELVWKYEDDPSAAASRRALSRAEDGRSASAAWLAHHS